MKEKQMFIYKLSQPHTQHVMEICSTVGAAELSQVKEIFSRANMIVDAQFYYTNPLMYVLIDSVSSDLARLYENYYLIPPRFYDAIQLNEDFFAVNEMFVKTIGSLSQLSEESGGLKAPRQELKNPKNEPSIEDSLFELYQQKGLYLIGIHGEK